jgi:hypothetical protein
MLAWLKPPFRYSRRIRDEMLFGSFVTADPNLGCHLSCRGQGMSARVEIRSNILGVTEKLLFEYGCDENYDIKGSKRR